MNTAEHPDDVAVDEFAFSMKIKLERAREKGRGGWERKGEVSQQQLSDLLRAHVEKGDPRDVANFCMFLHQRGESICKAATPIDDAPGQGDAYEDWHGAVESARELSVNYAEIAPVYRRAMQCLSWIERTKPADHYADNAPNCPTITDDEPVRIVWRDDQGRKCTTWMSANQIGRAKHHASPGLGDLVPRITEVLNLPDSSGKGLALTGQGYVLLHNIRAELSQAVALTDAEEVALYRMDSQREGRWPVVFFNASDYDTLRALVTRLTAASDGGGKGEGDV